MNSVKISEQIGNKEAFDSQERKSCPYAAAISPETLDATSFIEPGTGTMSTVFSWDERARSSSITFARNSASAPDNIFNEGNLIDPDKSSPAIYEFTPASNQSSPASFESSQVSYESLPASYKPMPASHESSPAIIKSKEFFRRSYKKLGKLGVGGFGTVWKGFRVADSTPVAIKEIQREKVTQWGKLDGQPVPMEAVFLMKLRGIKGVIEILDLCVRDNVFIIVMERPRRSKDLFDYITERGRLVEGVARSIFKKVIETLIECRRCGVFHGDVKDENILIDTKTKSIKIIDFGGAMEWTEGPSRAFSGTGLWSPPECNMKEAFYPESTTVWSLGCLLHAMLAGDIPFKSKINAISGRLDLNTLMVGPRALDLVTRCLALDPTKRILLNEVIRHPWMRNRNQKTAPWRSTEDRWTKGKGSQLAPWKKDGFAMRRYEKEWTSLRSAANALAGRRGANELISTENWLRARMDPYSIDNNNRGGKANQCRVRCESAVSVATRLPGDQTTFEGKSSSAVLKPRLIVTVENAGTLRIRRQMKQAEYEQFTTTT